MSASQMLNGSTEDPSASSFRAVDAPRESSRPTVPGSTELALRAFNTGAFELAVSELARCRLDDDPLTQLRIASEMESIARTTLDFGELLVRLELTDPLAPAAALGQTLLDGLEVTLARLKKRAGPQDHETIVDPAAPPEPHSAPEEVEDFLASRLSASASFLRAPFGASGRELRLVERNRHGYDIWWNGYFFALPHGRSPHLAVLLIRLFAWGRREIVPRIFRWVRQARAEGAALRRRLSNRSTRAERATLRRRLADLRTTLSDAPHPRARVLRVPLLRLSVTRTVREMQQHIEDRLRRAPRAD